MLRDLIDIPERVHAGEFVLDLSREIGLAATIDSYVVTEQLTDCFDQALGTIASAVQGRVSRAAYLDGSFGAGKSHFMAVLYGILTGAPAARGKDGLAEVVGKHDPWLEGRRFLLVPYHFIGAETIDAQILGGYVRHVATVHPEAPPPAVYRDDELLADARETRDRYGAEAILRDLPVASGADEEWDEPAWDATLLDAALSAPPGDDDRRRLVQDLLNGPFRRYARAVQGRGEAYIPLDAGLSVISHHAKDVLGYDALVLLLDEMVLWLSGHLSDRAKISHEAQKVSTLIESAEHDRPAPIISFVPRQRDLRELVGTNTAGAATASLFDTLKFWDGRFDRIKLEDRNLAEIIHKRILQPRGTDAIAELDAAFTRTTATRPEVWEALLDAQGDAHSADRDTFRRLYPFSPAFLHAMVDVSGALQRQRTALKLMQELLVEFRDELPVGQLMPLGAIFDVLLSGSDRPFSDKLSEEFGKVQRFYIGRVRPYLLDKHGLDEDAARHVPLRHQFRADDLVVKTLLLKALVPNVPALRTLTASRLAALNHGTVVSRVPGREKSLVLQSLRALAAEFGEIRVADEGDDPAVDIALIGVDTSAILDRVRHVDTDAARRGLLKDLLWQSFGVTDRSDAVAYHSVIWRGTRRQVELLFGNVRDETELSRDAFVPHEPGALRLVVDYPDDEADYGPDHDARRVQTLRTELAAPATLVWLPHFLSDRRVADLAELVKINYVLERDRLDDLAPDLTGDDRYHARRQLESRQANLKANLERAMRRAYGLDGGDDGDLGAHAQDNVLALDPRLHLEPAAGLGFEAALRRLCGHLLDHRYPRHPDFDQAGRGREYERRDLSAVLRVVDAAAQDKVGRYEVEAKPDRDALRRIANPLGLGTMHESAFVLDDAWPRLIDRAATAAGKTTEMTVADVRGWVRDEQDGMPEAIVDLVVCCYAMQTDRAWLRAGRPVTPAPEPGRLHGDMVLRRQELPGAEQFERASERAARIFGVARQPVLTARATQRLAADVRAAAAERLPAAEALCDALTAHAATLDLASDAPRRETARVAAELVDALAGSTDSTKLVTVLGDAELPRPAEIYRADLDHAADLVRTFADLRWQILDQLPALASGGGTKAGPARATLEALRTAARNDEHAQRLGPILTDAETRAIALVIDPIDPPPPPPPPPPPTGRTTRRAAGRELAGIAAELAELGKRNPNARYEVTWRELEAE